MFDDRVCPSCQVILPPGRTICPKCGGTVQHARTGVSFIDIPRKLYAWLAVYLGPVGAGIVAVIASLLILALLIAFALRRAARSL
jgi:hypothetical protein